MLITRTSPLSGINREMELDITDEQMTAWKDGMVIQEAMPNLSADEREFLLTGITKEEWEKNFGSE
jgi:hypothetical protein